ncbi:MAG: DUF4038 domain-containing protein [Bacteroidales bacterium]|nr:DUF4038 domain-containing protein [Bacteroidales bacterium]
MRSKKHFLMLFFLSSCLIGSSQKSGNTQQWKVFETSFISTKNYNNPFMDVQVDVLFTKDDKEWKIPAFWDGENVWKVRFAAPETGTYSYRVISSDLSNKSLNGKKHSLTVTAYNGDNILYKHGMIVISEGKRHFAHADGTPFFWLGDTWWKNLCKRLTWEGFQELAADRKVKGFTVIQIVAGPYPDEGPFEPMWKNEGGFMYENQDFTILNPEYWKYADRRFQHLVDMELVPAIVGAWGRADCDAMKHVGVEGLKRHWRYLIARYGAYPVMWILAGELHNDSKWGVGPWGEVGRYVREIDPYQHPITAHTGGGRRGNPEDDLIITYDMVGGSHDQNVAITTAIHNFTTTYSKEPAMPVLVGETCYEGHMQTGFPYVQRHMFWQYMLSGAAGHTYGAAGIWHASVEGDPGCASGAFGGRKVYDWTTWREGMNYPGATQVGLGKKFLEEYPWYKFEPHPEWAEEGSYAAGIPGEVRFIYQPRRTIYNWKGVVVRGLETDVNYTAYYFDPATGRRFDAGDVKVFINNLNNFQGHTQPLLYEDDFNRSAVGFQAKGTATDWKDYGTPTEREQGVLSGGKGMLTILEPVESKDVVVSCAKFKSDAEAGLVMRFQDADNYIVALYSPGWKNRVFLHDRQNGEYGPAIGDTDLGDIGEELTMTAAISGEYATIIISDGNKTWRVPPVKINNTKAGKTGLCINRIGEKQEFGKFEVSAMSSDDSQDVSGLYLAPDLPSPQDWVLVLEKVD